MNFADPHGLIKRRMALLRTIGRRLRHSRRHYLQPKLPWHRRSPRAPRLMPLLTGSVCIEIALLPAPNCLIRYARPPHNLERSNLVCVRQHDSDLLDALKGSVMVSHKSLKFGSSVDLAKLETDVKACHSLRRPPRHLWRIPFGKDNKSLLMLNCHVNAEVKWC